MYFKSEQRAELEIRQKAQQSPWRKDERSPPLDEVSGKG